MYMDQGIFRDQVESGLEGSKMKLRAHWLMVSYFITPGETLVRTDTGLTRLEEPLYLDGIR